MDNIGFALTLPGRYMDVRHVCRLLGSPATDVRSQIRINFSMTLNLLLSHSPGQVQDLLRLSFATWLIREKRERRGRPEPDRVHLWDDFTRHLEFLRVKGYVDADGRLTPDGGWASRLRVDQPLLIGEGFRHNLFPVDQPELMAAVIAVFVNEREADEQVDRRFLPLGLLKSYQQLTRRIGPLQQEMADWGFDGRRLYLRPAAAVFAWANGGAWEEAVGIAEVEEGDFAMLVLRTADNLRHVRALAEFFPGQAACADRAIELILRDPVV
jgi:superfamily II RNA helicase